MKRKSLKIVLTGVLAVLAIGGGVWALWERGRVVTTQITVDEPDSEELREFRNTRLFFGHQSVGSNVIAGMEESFVRGGEQQLVVVDTRDAVPEQGGYLAHSHVGVNGDPVGKIADFVSIMDGPMGDHVDVALLKFCYADVVSGTDVEALADAYSEAIEQLRSRHPSVRFLYATVPLSTDRGLKSTVKSWIGRDDQMGPADNLARQRYNDVIRARYAASGDLFDIAAVEATMATDPARRGDGEMAYYVLNPVLAADPGHLNELGSRAAASELIRVVADSTSR